MPATGRETVIQAPRRKSVLKVNEHASGNSRNIAVEVCQFVALEQVSMVVAADGNVVCWLVKVDDERADVVNVAAVLYATHAASCLFAFWNWK